MKMSLHSTGYSCETCHDSIDGKIDSRALLCYPSVICAAGNLVDTGPFCHHSLPCGRHNVCHAGLTKVTKFAELEVEKCFETYIQKEINE